MSVLNVKDLFVSYGEIKALSGISLHVEAGEIVAIIGPNGAGKSTLLNAICGTIRLTSRIFGQIIYEGKDITNTQPCNLAKKGISLVPQGRRIFSTMSVLENLQMGAYLVDDRKRVETSISRVFELFPELKKMYDRRARTLSSGEQQQLVIGRALMAEPKMLLLDEPLTGLSDNNVRLVLEKLQEIKKIGTAVLLVEQSKKAALRNSDRGYVFKAGKITDEGPSKDLLENKRVKDPYLGG